MGTGTEVGDHGDVTAAGPHEPAHGFGVLRSRMVVLGAPAPRDVVPVSPVNSTSSARPGRTPGRRGTGEWHCAPSGTRASPAESAPVGHGLDQLTDSRPLTDRDEDHDSDEHARHSIGAADRRGAEGPVAGVKLGVIAATCSAMRSWAIVTIGDDPVGAHLVIASPAGAPDQRRQFSCRVGIDGPSPSSAAVILLVSTAERQD